MRRGGYYGGSTIIRADPVGSLGGPSSSPSKKGSRNKRLASVDLRYFSPEERREILKKVRESRDAARKRARLKAVAERKKKAEALAAIRKLAAGKAPPPRVIEVPRRQERSDEPLGCRRGNRLSLPARVNPGGAIDG
jgi:hypothetical protein